MVYAPIYIPTLCRSEHFQKCIESLKTNTWARYTDVYIALDYPPSEKYRAGYEKICSYLVLIVLMLLKEKKTMVRH